VTAIVLFLILVSWQMAHFFAIAIYRLADYRDAGLPVMPVRIGILPTKVAIASYTLVFAYAAYALYVVQHLGLLYAITMSLLSLCWIAFSFYGFCTRDTDRWARRMFFYSLIVILLFSLVLALS
jgi:protoheme IX farnesyltransferase